MRSLPLLSIVMLAVLVPSKARADDRAIAEQAFQEGRELMAAGKVAQACPKFAAAAQLSQTAGVRLNLADCYVKLGKTASAWAKADEALSLAERTGDSAAAALARDQMSSLKPSLSYLTIDVSKESAPRGMEVTLDGEKLPNAVWGTPFPVDPGVYQIAVRAPGRKPWSTKTTVMDARAHASVSVPALASADTAGVPAPVASQPSGSQVGADVATSGGVWSRSTAHTLAFVSGGAAIVALGQRLRSDLRESGYLLLGSHHRARQSGLRLARRLCGHQGGMGPTRLRDSEDGYAAVVAARLLTRTSRSG
jgi:hypothetical protein